jgi:hypothetical protein
MFETVQMYADPNPAIEFARLFGVTTSELG